MSTPTAEAMARIVDQRDRTSARVDELEREARAAGEGLTAARAALVESERQGGRAAQRRQLEQALAEAKAKASEPWAERIEGARQAVRDADRKLQEFQGEHLSELVEALEADGKIATAELDAAAEALVQAFGKREEIARQIGAVASQVGRTHPGDVTFTTAQAVAEAARELLQRGGETPPTLRRDPRQPRLGQPAAADEKVEVA
jgi:chromosome segregation ATPase